MRRVALLAFLVSILLLNPVPLRAQTATATVTAGTEPRAVGVNPVTNKIYVANSIDDTVTVIDGADNSTATVNVADLPIAVGVNPVTNKIYVANFNSGDVTVIDGANDTVAATVTVGSGPFAVGVNPVTNKAYVANLNSNNVTVIDGATNSTVTVTDGAALAPRAVGVNPVTNKVYVVNRDSDNVTVIDGANDTFLTTVNVGDSPFAVGVNPVTNKVYVANSGSDNVTVIDGATNTTVTVTDSMAAAPFAVGVNPVTNKIYVANGSNNVTVIDGASDMVAATVTAGTFPVAVGVNPVTNKIYVANQNSDNVTVIDGASDMVAATVTAGIFPVAVGVNPVTNKVYVSNQDSDNATVIDGASNGTANVTAGINPRAVGVNPVTNKIYVVNFKSPTVTVIDGATNTTSAVAGVDQPTAVGVNPVTNKVYVTNFGDPMLPAITVTVIDGADNSTATVAVGTGSGAVGVNPVTNKIYVASIGPDTVTVINGADNSTTAVAAGSDPVAVGVNPVTNKIYVASSTSDNVTVIDGATDTAVATVTVGDFPLAVGVNPVTNKIYVPNALSDTVTVIDGATDSVLATVAAGDFPQEVDVNPVTNKIYVANLSSNNVTVIDGATNATTMVSVGGGPEAVRVNPVTNKVYVANRDTDNVTIIDGATDTVLATVAVGTFPVAVGVNPITNKLYVANFDSSNVTVITEQEVQAIPLTTTVTPLTDNQTVERTPTLSFTAQTTFSPTAPPVRNLFFQVDTWQGPWLPAQMLADFQGTLPALSLGTHILYAFATDGQEASGVTGLAQPLIGQTAAYLFTVVPADTTTGLLSDFNPAPPGATVTFTASVTVNAPGSGTPTGTAEFFDGATSLGTVALDGSAQAMLATSALTAGNHTITAVYSGDADFKPSTSPGLSQLINTVPVANPQSATLDANTALALTLTGTDADGNPLTFAISASPGHGTLTPIDPISATSAGVTYIPAQNFVGSDSFAFTVNDGNAASAPATVSLTVVGNTPVGPGAVVEPADPATGSTPVTLTFTEITEEGQTSLVISSTPPDPPAPLGFQLGDPPVYFNLSTTASFTPPIQVCIDFSGLGFASTEGLKLFHFENGEWANRTVSVDATNKIICAEVDSLSPFAVAAPLNELFVPNFQTFIPHTALGGGFLTRLFLTNRSDESNTVTISRRSQSGTVLESSTETLAPGATLQIAGGEAERAGEQAIEWIALGSEHPLAASVLFDFDSASLGLQDNFRTAVGALPGPPVASFTVPVRVATADVTVSLALANLTGASNTVNLTLRDAEGTALATDSLTLEAFAQTAINLQDRAAFRDLILGVPEFLGSLALSTEDPTAPVAALVIANTLGQLTSLPVSQSAIDSVFPPPSEPAPGLSQRTFLPHSATGGGFLTRLLLTNLTDTLNIVTLNRYDQDGQQVESRLLTLAPRGTQQVIDSEAARAGELNVNWFAFRSDTAATASVLFDFDSASLGLQENFRTAVGALPSLPLTAFTAPVRVATVDVTVGLALANLTTSTNTVTLKLLDETGAVVAQDEVTLGPLGQTAFSLQDRAAFSDVVLASDEFLGSLAVSSTQPVGALVVGNNLGQLFALPVTPGTAQ